MREKDKTPRWRIMALEYSQRRLRGSTHSPDRVRVEKSFLDGLRCLKSDLDREAERILAMIETSTAISEFERGQADGVRWLRETIEMNLGLDK